MRYSAAARLAVITALVACAFAAPAARADGGAHPSAAPNLPYGQHATGGDALVDNYPICCDFWRHPDSPGVKYWRLPLAFGDRITFDYGVVTGSDVGLCVLTPDITDYTVSESDCVVHDQTDKSDGQTKDEMTFTASTTGGWLLAVGDDACCDEEAWAYDILATVRHRSTLSLKGPKSRRKGSTVTLTGALTPARVAAVKLQRKVGTRWRSAGTATTAADGTFAFSYKLRKRGTYRFRASYPGDASYLAARSRPIKVKSRR
jgi:hypothetical protein